MIDEARDFVPSGRAVPGKENLIQLVAQARKYGLGILFATQAPKGIDNKIIANCATQFYGRAAAPAAIQTVQEQLRLRGGTGNDIARLTRGVFYAHSDGMAAPARVATRMCLSAHPPSPPSELEVLERVQKSRALTPSPRARRSGGNATRSLVELRAAGEIQLDERVAAVLAAASSSPD